MKTEAEFKTLLEKAFAKADPSWLFLKTIVKKVIQEYCKLPEGWNECTVELSKHEGDLMYDGGQQAFMMLVSILDKIGVERARAHSVSNGAFLRLDRV